MNLLNNKTYAKAIKNFSTYKELVYIIFRLHQTRYGYNEGNYYRMKILIKHSSIDCSQLEKDPILLTSNRQFNNFVVYFKSLL